MQQNYSTQASRNLIDAEMKMLAHAETEQVLTMFGDQKSQPQRKTDTRVFRRLNPFNMNAAGAPDISPNAFITAEGATPTPNSISYTDVTAVLQHYNVLFKFSDKAELMYEDDIPSDMAQLTGETIAEIAELVAYGQMKAGSSVNYTNGTTRVGLASTISIDSLDLAARGLYNARAKRVTKTIASGPNFDTAPVEPGYVIFVPTDMVSDVRKIDGFVKRVEYGSAVSPVHPNEFGSVNEYRFVSSSLFTPFLAAGASYDGSFVSAATTNNDVYPLIIIGQDCIGHISLKGKGYSGIKPTIISSQIANHANPGRAFGYVGADFYYTCVRLNDNFMKRIESCASVIQ
jgi:N4-gp56 family major capsid protein